jgi:hypothetical protein
MQYEYQGKCGVKNREKTIAHICNAAASKHGGRALPRGTFWKGRYITRNVVRACGSLLDIPVTAAADE